MPPITPIKGITPTATFESAVNAPPSGSGAALTGSRFFNPISGIDSPSLSSPLSLPRLFTSSREVLAPEGKGSISPFGSTGESYEADLATVEKAINCLWNANLYFRRSYRIISNLKNEYLRGGKLLYLVPLLAKAGMETQARWLLNRALGDQEDVWLDDRHAGVTVASVMTEFGIIIGDSKFIDEAHKFVSGLESQGHQSRAYESMAVAIAKLALDLRETKHLEMAWDVSNKIREQPYRSLAQLEVVVSTAKLGVLFNDRSLKSLAYKKCLQIEDDGYGWGRRARVEVEQCIVHASRTLKLIGEHEAREREAPRQAFQPEIQAAEMGIFMGRQSASLIKPLGGFEGKRAQSALRQLALQRGELFAARVSALLGDSEGIEPRADLTLLYRSMILLAPEEQKRVRRGILRALPPALSEKENKILVTALGRLNALSDNSAFFEYAKKRLNERSLNDPEVTTIVKGLIETRQPKALNLAVRLIGDPTFRPKDPHLFPWQYRFWLVRELEKVGHIEKGVNEFIDHHSPDLMNRWLRGMVGELGLPISLMGLEALVNGKWEDEGRSLKSPEEVCAYLKKKRETYALPANLTKFIGELAQNRDEATLYYLLFAGRTRFALVDTNFIDQFHEMIRIIHDDLGPVHEGIMRFFKQVLRKRVASKIPVILKRLRQGHWPLGNERYARSLTVDVSSEKVLTGLKQRLQSALSFEQLGAMIEATVAEKVMTEEERNNPEIQEILKKIENSSNLRSLSALVGGLKQLVPTLRIRVESRWGSVFENLPGSDDPSYFKSIIEGKLRDELIATLRKQARISRNLQKRKDLKEIIQALEEEEPDRRMKADEILAIFIESQLRSNDDILRLKHREEWRSHLREIFDGVEALNRIGEGEKIKRLTYRYLDKGENLIEILRFADGVQNCFTSEGEENIERKKAWLTRIHKDPLSFVFLIEDNEPNASERRAIGFVFGSFGVVDDQLAVLLNGVYMQGKTNEATMAILNATEEDFSKPLGASYQIVAATNGGETELDPKNLHATGNDHIYSNEAITFIRLRALAHKIGGPETKIYDDLGDDVNIEVTTEPENPDEESCVWWKRI